ncbi:MAG: carboxypeptidase-like regulatory domain-containing protein [Gemmatimonadales bacterium]
MRIVSSLLAAGLVVAAATPSPAQDLSVRVVHAADGSPLVGALISLRDSAGVVQLRALTGPGGRVALRVRPGRYVPRADAIGFRGVDGAASSLTARRVRSSSRWSRLRFRCGSW